MAPCFYRKSTQTGQCQVQVPNLNSFLLDFPFPEDKIQRVIIDKEKLAKMNLNSELEPDIAPFELIFDKNKVPSELK